MPTNVEIPALGESVTEAVLVRWIKRDGEQVKTDDPLCELETDKANVELPSPGAGVLKRLKKEGETVRIGETVAEITAGAVTTAAAPAKEAAKAEAPKAQAPAESEAPGSKPELWDNPLSPSVRRLVREHGVKTEELEGTGPRGRVTKEDVLSYVDRHQSAPSAPKATAPSAPRPAPASQPAAKASPASGGDSSAPSGEWAADGTKRVPMTKLRRRIAERLVKAQHDAAMLTTFNEIDMSSVMELRERYKAKFQDAHGVSLGLMSFFARAVILALREYPVINASIDGDDLIYHRSVHLSIAVSTERGLVVPVLRNAEGMSFAKIESEIKRTAIAAREGKLSLDELSGGTFTITNGGVFGSLLSTPILNPPQSGILGLHAIQKRPCAVDDKVVIRPMMYVALSYDHRLIDGKDSVSFLVKVKQGLEDPARLMLEI